MPIIGLRHVGASVGDVETALDFFANVLGARLDRFELLAHEMRYCARVCGVETPVPHFSGAFVSGRQPNDTAIDLYCAKGLVEGEAIRTAHQIGMPRIGLRVTGLDEMIARIQRYGFHFVAPPTSIGGPSGDTRRAVFHGPEGIGIELIEVSTDTPVEPGLDFVEEVHINCADLDRSLEFYRDRLGLALLAQHEVANADAKAIGRLRGIAGDIALRIGILTFPHDLSCAQKLVLTQWLKPVGIGQHYPVPGLFLHRGLVRFALRVDDTDEMYAQARSRGVSFVTPPETVLYETSSRQSRIVCFLDPDGVMGEFVAEARPPNLAPQEVIPGARARETNPIQKLEPIEECTR